MIIEASKTGEKAARDFNLHVTFFWRCFPPCVSTFSLICLILIISRARRVIHKRMRQSHKSRTNFVMVTRSHVCNGAGIRQWQISRFQFRMIFNPKSTTNPWTLTSNFEKEVEMPWPYMQKGQAESYPFTHLSYHTRSSIGISSSEVRAGNTTELQIPIERQLMAKLKNC